MYSQPPTANSSLPISGCMHIFSSASQQGKQLSVICTLRHTNEEAEGAILFLCKDRPLDCSPETSLKHLSLRRSPETDGVIVRSSQLVFTLTDVTPSASGTYQCCAKSQTPEILLQGHFLSVSVTGELLTSQIPQTGPQQVQQLGTVGISGPDQAASLRKSFPLPILFPRPHWPVLLSQEGNLILPSISKKLTEVAVPFLLTLIESRVGKSNLSDATH